jgi:hypothetical protein
MQLRRSLVGALLTLSLVVPATASAAPAQTHKVTYDHYSFSLDGQRVWLWSAEFHYFRLPSPDLWRDQLEKLKAAGFNTVSLYGETLADEVRGPQNNGGLFGERSGWSLPGFADGGWESVTLPHPEPEPGIAWYRTKVRLQLPNDQDVPIGLRFTDDPSRHYRVLIFANGWNLGQSVNDVGPQHVFVLPEGILRHRGVNTIVLAVWSDDATSGGLGQVSLEALGNTATSLRVRDVASPG